MVRQKNAIIILGHGGNSGRSIPSRKVTQSRLKRCHYLPTRPNFLLARPTRHAAADVAAQLRASGILVRHFGTPGLSDWLRISIGTEAEMTALTAALTTMNKAS